MLERIQKFPLVQFAINRPAIAAWIVLSVGMVTLLVIEARDVALEPTQWLSLIVATVLVAGACVWIISWEDEDEMEADSDHAATTVKLPSVQDSAETQANKVGEANPTNEEAQT